MRGFFITGTGTDVGKTVATAVLLRGLLRADIDAVPCKPVQTGVDQGFIGDGRSPDLSFVLRATGLKPPSEEIPLMAPCVYKNACSPHLAARIEGREPDMDLIRTSLRSLGERHEMVLVEGAGGILVPIVGRTLMADLARELGLPVIVVAMAGLGTINHTLLTIEALRSRGLQVAAVILNETHPVHADDEYIVEDNAAAIAEHGDVPVLGRLPHTYGDTPWTPARLDDMLADLAGWNDFKEKWL